MPRRLSLSLLMSVVIWAVFTWPLPLHLGRGIPSSARNVEPGNVRRMIPGDHLQLLYYFDLAAETFRGRVPLFTDPYQFDAGPYTNPFPLYHYYVPQSLIYACLKPVAGQAAAWNLTGFLYVWGAYLLLWVLVRRYAYSEAAAALGALPVLVLPCRWHALLGGSPSGFAPVWTALTILGLDAVGRGAPWAGALASVAGLVFLRAADGQAFYFVVLSSPFWLVLGLVHGCFSGRRPRWGRVIAGTAVAGLGVLAGVTYSLLIRWRHLAVSTMREGRPLAETVLFSPHWQGLFSWSAGSGATNQIFIGVVIPVLLFAGLAVGLRNLRDRHRRGDAVILVLLVAATVVLVLLSLGVRGPHHGLVFRAARRMIPGFHFLRQPARIFSLMPVLLALGVVAALGCLRPWKGRGGRLLPYLVGIVFLLECKAQVSTTVCLLDRDQPAYQAVVEDASQRSIVPRAVVIPLWPGDSAWSSLYQHYAMLHGLHMLNGYLPVTGTSFVENVFRPLKGLNSGVLDRKRLQLLSKLRVNYLLLHENAFPEKVSPFAVAFTLDRLLRHPRLHLLRHAGPVWAFAIRAAADSERARPAEGSRCSVICPTRHFYAGELTRRTPLVVRRDDRVTYLRLDEKSGSELRLPAISSPPADRLRWMILARGAGRLEVCTEAPGLGVLTRSVLPIDCTDPRWFQAPLSLSDYTRIRARLVAREGVVEVAHVFLGAGEWDPPLPGEEILLPAFCLFHAGHTTPALAAVELDPERDPHAVVLYGPKLPLVPGEYEIELEYDSDAPPGTRLGRFNVRHMDRGQTAWQAVVVGRPATLRFEEKVGIPFFVALLFERRAPMTAYGVRVRRLR
ncbi:MAG TPA: hypothetical protein EYP62_06605 [Kiritimatiellae bacterium]|nr:hypothetical protein [Kiritimatiellia bacterium]